jgi:hypothetical protein
LILPKGNQIIFYEGLSGQLFFKDQTRYAVIDIFA